MKKVFVIGDLCLDVIVPYKLKTHTLEYSQHASYDFESNPDKVTQRSGGSSANVAVVLSKLGQTPYLITMEGNDAAGRYLKEQMIRVGVNMDYSIASDHGSIVCIAVIDDNNDRKMFTWCPDWSDFDDFKPEHFAKINPDEQSIFYFSGIIITHDEASIGAVLDFLEYAKSKGSTIVFDLNLRAQAYGAHESRMKIFKRAISIADYVLGSGIEEFGALTGQTQIEAAIDAIRREDLTIIERNQGDPVHVHIGLERMICVPVPKVQQVNTIGAGDTFNGAFLSKLMCDEPVERAVAFANEVASFKVSSEEHLAVPEKYRCKRRDVRCVM